MTGWTEYHTPRTSEAAPAALWGSPELALILSGTALLLYLEQGGQADVGSLVDFQGLPVDQADLLRATTEGESTCG